MRAMTRTRGNMGLSAREMPNGDGLVAWQNVERRALALHAAGVPGTTGQLQVQAMLDYLLGRATPEQDKSAREDAHVDNAGEGARQDAQCEEDQDAARDDDEDDTIELLDAAGQGTTPAGLARTITPTSYRE
jgi:hypothetical protein